MPAGTLEYTRSASHSSPFLRAFMMAAACTPVAVRKASLPTTGYCAGTGTPVASEASRQYSRSFERSPVWRPSR